MAPVASELGTSGEGMSTLIVLQHGSHGHASDFDNISSALSFSWNSCDALADMPMEIWTTPVNEGWATDDGLVCCGERLVAELRKALEQRAAALRAPDSRLQLICIGHSFGGVLLRYALAALERLGALAQVELAAFVTLASPHLGARQLSLSLRLGARFLGKVFSTAYQDLLLDSEEMDRLCEPEALAPLGRFRSRLLYASARGDHLVGFESAALLVPSVQMSLPSADLPPATAEFPHVRTELILEPFAALPETSEQRDSSDSSRERQLLQREPDGSVANGTVAEAVDVTTCASRFAGFDDRSGDGARRMVRMMRQLRSVGHWSVHIVDIPGRLVLAHGAIIHHPNNAKNPGGHGNEVAAHLANSICSVMSKTLKASSTSQKIVAIATS